MEVDLHHIADNTHRGAIPGGLTGGHEVIQYSSIKDFMDTKLPVFKEEVEPLEADELINTMEQKFRLLWMIEELNVEYCWHFLTQSPKIAKSLIPSDSARNA